MVYTTICKNCGKEYRAKTIRSMFCSEECRREADKERKRIRYGATKEKRVCPECGRTFETKSVASNFCSRACSVKFSEKRRKNKDEFDEDMRERISLKSVFVREKGICYLCGGKCDFEDIILKDGLLAAGNTFPAVDYIKAKDTEKQSAKLAHFYCLSRKGEKNDRVQGNTIPEEKAQQ